MNAASTSRRPIALAALAIALLALGVGLRFYRLGAKSLWLDEAQTLFYVDRPLGETLAAVRARDAHPPLYYALLHLWMGGSSCEARARAFSALASTLTLVVFFDLARRLLGIGAALVAAGVLAVSAFQVYFAQEARHYALATLWVTLAWWFLVLLLKRGKGRAWPLWLGLAVANTAALYTFYYTLFAIVAQGAFFLVAWRERGRRLLPRWLVCQAAVGAAFAPYVPVVLARARQLREL
ncbi:MAG: glycosyltransferase family 39 protein, partial [Candidatus Brocadiae bacterium]|nr:glycosyltransferase family 39 protein [Candidatus Brocadiia bacterium]